MCGRYLLDAMPEQFARDLAVHAEPLQPRYNIAPTQLAPVVVWSARNDSRMLISARWGLVPHWAKAPRSANPLINARAETVEQLPSFRDAYARRRVLVPASGYYEWTGAKNARQAQRIMRRDRRLLALAGLLERWRAPGAAATEPPLLSFAIVTCSASDDLRAVHDRMPLWLAGDDQQRWLQASAEEARTLLAVPVADVLTVAPVAALRPDPISATAQPYKTQQGSISSPTDVNDGKL